jgi:cytochrome c oxidase assembly protein subunit 15
MVRSGLIDRPQVSQYRLAAHLALAVLLYGYLVWLALGLSCDSYRDRAPTTPLFRALAYTTTLLVFQDGFESAHHCVVRDRDLTDGRHVWV